MNELSILIAAALLALQSQKLKKPFRQRDVRFYVELFSNWIEYAGGYDAMRVHNNQIARELKNLAKKGLIKKTIVQDRPSYNLTSLGLVACLRNIFTAQATLGIQYIFFKTYFLSNYGQQIRMLLRSSIASIPTGLKLEIDPLLDCKNLIREALLQSQKDKQRLETRISDAIQMPKAVRKLLKNKSWEETVTEVEKMYPYELNSMKSLTALLANLPEDLAKWELTDGSELRARQIWQPLHSVLCRYISELQKVNAQLG